MQRLARRLVKGLTVAAVVVLAPVVGLLLLSAVLWALSFADPAPAQDDCAFGPVTKADYQRLLRQARAQDWTVWPGLSRGLFWPSEGGLLASPTGTLEPIMGERLLRAVRQLTGTNSADEQLAAAHAVMRSMRAEYVSVWNIPDFRENGKLVRTHAYFTYFIPQIREAPLCFLCLIWWDTTIAIVFLHDIASGSYALDRVVVRNADLKYNPKKERNIPEACPAFPRAQQQK